MSKKIAGEKPYEDGTNFLRKQEKGLVVLVTETEKEADRRREREGVEEEEEEETGLRLKTGKVYYLTT
ncbi:hypothetical protein M0802_001881 [Mischocyttarus mexicanus]|nr:hypothetical protein M0802_001881 [Mischocyttarus mexicanus]